MSEILTWCLWCRRQGQRRRWNRSGGRGPRALAHKDWMPQNPQGHSQENPHFCKALAWVDLRLVLCFWEVPCAKPARKEADSCRLIQNKGVEQNVTWVAKSSKSCKIHLARSSKCTICIRQPVLEIAKVTNLICLHGDVQACYFASKTRKASTNLPPSFREPWFLLNKLMLNNETSWISLYLNQRETKP